MYQRKAYDESADISSRCGTAMLKESANVHDSRRMKQVPEVVRRAGCADETKGADNYKNKVVLEGRLSLQRLKIYRWRISQEVVVLASNELAGVAELSRSSRAL